jgi:hypothetical protein
MSTSRGRGWRSPDDRRGQGLPPHRAPEGLRAPIIACAPRARPRCCARWALRRPTRVPRRPHRRAPHRAMRTTSAEVLPWHSGHGVSPDRRYNRTPGLTGGSVSRDPSGIRTRVTAVRGRKSATTTDRDSRDGPDQVRHFFAGRRARSQLLPRGCGQNVGKSASARSSRRSGVLPSGTRVSWQSAARPAS